MQKAFSLQQFEIAQAQTLEEERRNLLARLGGLTLEMENVRGQIPGLDQRSRSLVQAVAQRAGVPNFLNARIDGGNLVCELPDEPPAAAPSLPAAIQTDIGRVNGEAIATKR